MDTQDTSNLSELTADIVAAYVSNNNVRVEDLPALISEVHSALQRAPNGNAKPAPPPDHATPHPAQAESLPHHTRFK